MHGTTAGRSAPRRFTTMRDVAHITDAGLFCRMLQHPSVISGASVASPISGNNTSRVRLCDDSD